MTNTSATSAHQIERVCANPPGRDRGQDKNQELVEVLNGSTNLAGHRLQHITNPKSQNPKWKDLFAFPATAIFSKGTHIVVHGGGSEDGYDPQGHYHYYAAGADGKGNWKLNNDGDTVRLLDTQGNEICRRVLSGDECESITTAPVVVPPALTPAPRAYGKIVD